MCFVYEMSAKDIEYITGYGTLLKSDRDNALVSNLKLVRSKFTHIKFLRLLNLHH